MTRKRYHAVVEQTAGTGWCMFAPAAPELYGFHVCGVVNLIPSWGVNRSAFDFGVKTEVQKESSAVDFASLNFDGFHRFSELSSKQPRMFRVISGPGDKEYRTRKAFQQSAAAAVVGGTSQCIAMRWHVSAI